MRLAEPDQLNLPFDNWIGVFAVSMMLPEAFPVNPQSKFCVENTVEAVGVLAGTMGLNKFCVGLGVVA